MFYVDQWINDIKIFGRYLGTRGTTATHWDRKQSSWGLMLMQKLNGLIMKTMLNSMKGRNKLEMIGRVSRNREKKQFRRNSTKFVYTAIQYIMYWIRITITIWYITYLSYKLIYEDVHLSIMISANFNLEHLVFVEFVGPNRLIML